MATQKRAAREEEDAGDLEESEEYATRDEEADARPTEAEGQSSAQLLTLMMQQMQRQNAAFMAAMERVTRADETQVAAAAAAAVAAAAAAAAATPATAAPQRAQRKALPVKQAPVLAYDQASDSGALEDWLDSMETMFSQLELDEDSARLRELLACIDRDVKHWWSEQQAQAARDGKPLATWAAFKGALRSQFLPQSEAHTAVEELIDIRQQPGEPMEKYFMRATRLCARAGDQFPDKAAMRIVLHRARKDEWRHAVAIATRDVHAGTITTLAQLRACLQREALAEPGRPRAGAAPSGQARAATGGGYKKPTTTRTAAAAVIQKPEETSGAQSEETPSAPGGAGSTTTVAAAQHREGPRACYRCGDTGHMIAECPKPRVCYRCNKPGHVRAECPEAKSKNL